jgi:arylsulfatase A-like enzyme
VADPDPRADMTRGRVDARFVEAVDVVPTILAALRIPGAAHRIEGRSLLPLTRDEVPAAWRDCTFCELDYSFRRARRVLGRNVRECRAFMARTSQWKYVHWEGFRPQLFDLANDPLELIDLGSARGYERVRTEMHTRLFDWLADLACRTTIDDALVEARTDAHRGHGVHIGIW